MNTREDKPKEYFVKLLNIPEIEVDYRETPATSRADWEDAEVLLPVSLEEFRAIQEFIQDRRRRQKINAADRPS